MFSSSTNDLFVTNIKSNNKDNNVVDIIERLFLNIKYILSYKRSTKKMAHKI